MPVQLGRRYACRDSICHFEIEVMPGLTGPEASLKMAAVRPDLPFLFVSGHAHDHHLAIIQSHSTAAILQKPYDGKVLADKVREMLAWHHN